MHSAYRIIGWAALLAGLSFVGQPLVVGVVAPAVFGTTEMVIDPAVIQRAGWLAALETSIFLGVAGGLTFMMLAVDRVVGGADSVGEQAHNNVGLAAAIGWLIVAAASAARYSSVVGTAAPFGDDDRATFFLAQAMDITTGVFVASIASGLWWLGAALRRPVAELLGRPLTVMAGVTGAITVIPNLIGIPWGVLLQIPLLITLGLVFLRRAGRQPQTTAELGPVYS